MTPTPPNTTESKSDKFIRLANHRTNRVLKYLDALGNLTNKSVYEYTPEQVTRIIEAIDLAVNTCEKKLLGLEPKPQFKL